jgi:hypothetical protein
LYASRLEKKGSKAAMNYIVDATPRECIQSGIVYMVNEGYTVDTQTDTTVTLSRVGQPEGVGCCLLLLVATVLTLGVALVILALAYYLDKWRATIVTIQDSDGRTRLTINGSHPQPRKSLESWVKQEFGARAVPEQA